MERRGKKEVCQRRGGKVGGREGMARRWSGRWTETAVCTCMPKPGPFEAVHCREVREEVDIEQSWVYA